MGQSSDGFASLDAIYDKQYQNQSTIILTGASYDFRSAQHQQMIAQSLDALSALCTTADTTPSETVAYQFGQQCDALGKLLTNIQAADLQAISTRATLSQPKLKGAANNLKEVDNELIANLNSLHKLMVASAAKAEDNPRQTDQYNPGATISWS